MLSRRMQVQERLTDQIKDCIQEALEPLGVAVVIEAQHMCMQMRGIENKILLPLPLLYRAFEKKKQEKNLLA
jgi:GTP cyclohydrolase I